MKQGIYYSPINYSCVIETSQIHHTFPTLFHSIFDLNTTNEATLTDLKFTKKDFSLTFKNVSFNIDNRAPPVDDGLKEIHGYLGALTTLFLSVSIMTTLYCCRNKIENCCSKIKLPTILRTDCKPLRIGDGELGNKELYFKQGGKKFIYDGVADVFHHGIERKLVPTPKKAVSYTHLTLPTICSV